MVPPRGFEPLISALKGRSTLERNPSALEGKSSVDVRQCPLSVAVTVVKTVVNQPDDSSEAAPDGRPPYLVEGGAPKGIRTPDLRLERAAS